jgi:aconitase B
VYGQRGRWISSGGELNASTKDKQYIAVVSVDLDHINPQILDIVIYLTDISIPNDPEVVMKHFKDSTLDSIRVLGIRSLPIYFRRGWRN